MKKNLLFVAIAFLFASCAKKPEACVEPSASKVSVGQEITFKNCSQNADKSNVDYGDDKTEKGVGATFTHIYTLPGTYNVKLTATTDKDKEDEVSTTITVKDIEKAEVLGSWNLYKSNMSLMGWFFGTSDFTPENIDYVFASDSVTITENTYSPQKEKWSLSTKGVLTIGYNTYQIQKLYDNEMIWDDGEYVYYLTKK